MLRVEQLKVATLPGLTFEVRDGECLSVEGPSGSGKTRLLRAVADLDEAPGDIYLDGVERREVAAPDWRKRVRYGSAEPGWWSETPRHAMPAAPSAQARVPRLMTSIGLELELLDRSISLLSTGERQRLSLVRALCDDAKVLLLDEPTASLDPTNAALVEELIRFQLLGGRSVLLVTHDAAMARRLAHNHLLLARTGSVRDPKGAAP